MFLFVVVDFNAFYEFIYNYASLYDARWQSFKYLSRSMCTTYTHAVPTKIIKCGNAENPHEICVF